MPTSRQTRRRLSIVGAGIAAVLAVGLYLAFQHAGPLLTSSGCAARADGQVVTLGTGQAGIAATIAGVARSRALPSRAVTVAYATALQESKLRNLGYGDRDSVGVFQQRPSQGWGTRQELEDPVYAATKFFEALVRVPGYQRLPVYQAAQAVQHSADGYAYRQYQDMAAEMARAFTGDAARGVWCWYGQADAGKARPGAAGRELTRTFKSLATHVTADPGLEVRARPTSEGWAVAAWLVSHADQYRIRQVRYGDYRWTAARGNSGWLRYRPTAPRGVVEAN